MHAFRAWIVNGVLACLTAFQILTRFPLLLKISYTDKLFRKSIVFYPFVGAVIGLIITLAGAGLREWLPSFPASIILLSLWIAITGADNLAGLMFTVDIKKNSHVGASGVIVCVLVLLLKLSFIMELVDGSWRFAAVFYFCTPIWSRWFIGITVVRRLYIRVGATITAYSLSLGALWIFGFGGVELVLYSFGFPLISGLIGWLLVSYLKQKLGRLTEYTYGALNELLELLLLLGALILWN